LAEFTQFVRHEDSSVLPAMEAIAETATPSTAAEFLGTTKGHSCRVRSRLRQVGRCFLNDEPVPRQRRPYKPRVEAICSPRVAVALSQPDEQKDG